MPENEEKPTAVYAKKVHKGGFGEVNRAFSKQTLICDANDGELRTYINAGCLFCEQITNSVTISVTQAQARIFNNREFITEWAGLPLPLRVTADSSLDCKIINEKELNAVEVGAIRQFITLLWKHYSEAAAKEQKKKIIDAIQTTLGYHRKSIIRLLSSAKPPELRRKSGNREPKYNKEDEKWLVRIWRSMGKICSERIVAALEDWIPALKLKLGLPQRIAEKLLEMSASTMDRKLAPYRNRERRQENTGTVRSIFTAIPIKPLGITVSGPGFVEIDSVAHCGGDLSGTFAWTISATDIATNMTFCRAVLGKSAEAVTAALLEIEKCFPFPIHTFWFDNGTEFINELVLQTFANRPDLPIRIERSRPYKKNDQAHIEEKNWTHVRQIFGYVRIESKKAIAIMNKIYESAWCPLHNFYLPQSKTIEKWRVGAKVRRKVDKPKTPYTRLLESGSLSENQSQLLTRQRNRHDPLDFKRELDLLFVDLRKEMGSRVLLMPRRFSEGLCLRSTEEAS